MIWERLLLLSNFVISKKTAKIFILTTAKGKLKNSLPCDCTQRLFSYRFFYLRYIGDLLCSNNLNWNVKPDLKEEKKIHKTHTNQSSQVLKQFNPHRATQIIQTTVMWVPHMEIEWTVICKSARLHSLRVQTQVLWDRDGLFVVLWHFLWHWEAISLGLSVE